MLVDYWFWIFRDAVTGRKRSTGWRITVVEERTDPLVQPHGTFFGESESDFEDTVPLVFHREHGQQR